MWSLWVLAVIHAVTLGGSSVSAGCSVTLGIGSIGNRCAVTLDSSSLGARRAMIFGVILISFS